MCKKKIIKNQPEITKNTSAKLQEVNYILSQVKPTTQAC